MCYLQVHGQFGTLTSVHSLSVGMDDELVIRSDVCYLFVESPGFTIKLPVGDSK